MPNFHLCWLVGWLQFCRDAKWKIDKGSQKNFSPTCSQVACPCIVSTISSPPWHLTLVSYILYHLTVISAICCSMPLVVVVLSINSQHWSLFALGTGIIKFGAAWNGLIETWYMVDLCRTGTRGRPLKGTVYICGRDRRLFVGVLGLGTSKKANRWNF